MRILVSMFRFVQAFGLLLFAGPLLIVIWLVFMAVATVVGWILVGLTQYFVFGYFDLNNPDTVGDWLLHIFFIGLCWAVATWFFTQYTGLSSLFGQSSDSHGSARFASSKELKAMTSDNPDSLLIGRNPQTGKLMRYDGPAHLLTLAPTRAGKGVGTVIPNLLLSERSVLVIDPKGENAQITGTARKRFGAVHVLDPFGVTEFKTACYNPLDRLKPDSLDLGEDAATLTEALVMDPPGETSEAHWNEEAKALLGGFIMFCVCHETKDRRSLGTVREYLTLPPERLRELLELMQESDAAGGLIARAANRFLGKADREAASVMSNAQRHTHFLDSPRISHVTSRSDFNFSQFMHEVGSVFLVLPPNRLDAYSRWLRLLVSQALQDIARAAETRQPRMSGLEASERPRTSMLFLLDEFAALGRLEAVERAMGLMAGYGLQLWPILQDMSQLKDLYGKRAGTFIANAGVQQVFGVNDYETAKWLSQMIGQETRGYTTTSHKPGDPASVSQNVTARDLVTPDEIMQLPSHLQLLRVQGHPTAIAAKLRYYADQEFAGLFAK